MYRVFYWWHGEKHEHSRRPETSDQAERLVKLMRRDGWKAYFELIG